MTPYFEVCLTCIMASITVNGVAAGLVYTTSHQMTHEQAKAHKTTNPTHVMLLSSANVISSGAS